METKPNGNRYWLKEHQITAFWHDFGISNALHIPKEYVSLHRYSRGTPREVYTIDPAFMRKQLKEYISWLRNYKETWNTDEKHPYDADTREKFLVQESRHESRADVLEMIELLQECRIEDTDLQSAAI